MSKVKEMIVVFLVGCLSICLLWFVPALWNEAYNAQTSFMANFWFFLLALDMIQALFIGGFCTITLYERIKL